MTHDENKSWQQIGSAIANFFDSLQIYDYRLEIIWLEIIQLHNGRQQANPMGPWINLLLCPMASRFFRMGFPFTSLSYSTCMVDGSLHEIK